VMRGRRFKTRLANIGHVQRRGGDGKDFNSKARSQKEKGCLYYKKKVHRGGGRWICVVDASRGERQETMGKEGRTRIKKKTITAVTCLILGRFGKKDTRLRGRGITGKENQEYTAALGIGADMWWGAFHERSMKRPELRSRGRVEKGDYEAKARLVYTAGRCERRLKGHGFEQGNSPRLR